MVVGWYHSHPGFGCWLSGVDINTQQVGGVGAWRRGGSGKLLSTSGRIVGGVCLCLSIQAQQAM